MIPVTIGIPTKTRYFTTLPLTIQSILNQTELPEKIIIYDDTDSEKAVDLRTIPIYQYLFSLMKKLGVDFEVLWGKKLGQVTGHQIIMERSKTNLIFRIDDDEIAPYNLLEKLYHNMKVEVGASTCLVHDPTQTPELSTYNHEKDTVNKML